MKGKNLLRFIILFRPAIIVTVFMMASGCGASENPERQVGREKSKDTVSIVISGLGMSFPAGMDENDNRYLHYIEEQTGLDIHVTTPPTEVYDEKLDVIMSSGNLPDMLHAYESVWFGNYAKQGALQPLDDLIERYGPHLKAKIPAEAWERVKYGGKIYAVPSLQEVSGVELVYARKDWLDRLGLDKPETLEDYREVIEAFTRNDPDGNGIDDTIGLTMTNELGRTSPFFGAFGIQLDTWFEVDGRLVNGSIMPETREALAFLSELYREGLLDREFPLNLQNNLYEKIENGKVGLFSATWYDTRGPIAASKRRDPKAEWIALPYPTGREGHKGVIGKDIIRGYNIIPAGSPHAKEVIQLLDFIAADYKNLKLGFENEIWKEVDGRIVTDFNKHDEHLYRGIYQSLVDVPDPVLFKERLDSLGDFHLYDNLEMIRKHVMKDAFYGIPTPAMSKYDKRLKELQSVFTRMILGLEPLEAFDRYVEDWMAEGGEEMTQEVNLWLENQKERTSGGEKP